MKVSKVNHVRAAVNKKGILYNTPVSEKRNVIEIKGHVREVNEKAQKLYATMGTIDEEIEKVSPKDLNNFKRVFDGYIKECAKTMSRRANKYGFDASKFRNVFEQTTYYSSKKDRTTGEWKNESIASGRFFKWNSDPKTVINQLINTYLRKSLYRTEKAGTKEVYLPDALKKLALAVYDKENFPNGVNALSYEEKTALAQAIYKDYSGEKKIDSIAESIQSQDVKVQSFSKDGKTVLKLSSAEDLNKTNPGKNKGFIFEFLKDFCNADKSGQDELRKHMRKLILLYYCGPEAYRTAEDNGIFADGFGECLPDEAESFCQDAIEEMANLPIAEEKGEKKRVRAAIKKALEEQIAASYRIAVKEPGITESDRFWIDYIEKTAGKIIVDCRMSQWQSRCMKKSLCLMTYQEWETYISSRFIDMGKAAYHFAMPKDLTSLNAASFGTVNALFKDGITSFDYEYIKAEESIEREISGYISSALNTFTASSILPAQREELLAKKDILSLRAEDENLSENMMKNILRFFGGSSVWKEKQEFSKENRVAFFSALQDRLRYVRNSSFHYASGEDTSRVKENPAVLALISGETERVGSIFAKKYYSNNVPMFYTEKDIEKMMENLYAKENFRPAQIPSFQSVVNHSDMDGVLTALVGAGYNSKIKSVGADITKQYRSAMYFVLKEIYYNDFLKLEDIKERFRREALNYKSPQATEKKDPPAESFRARISDLCEDKTITFAEICQQLMTDMQLQQGEMAKKPESKQNVTDKKAYIHFRLILESCIRSAFLDYVKNDGKYAFLLAPMYRKEAFSILKEEEFLPSFKPAKYSALLQGFDAKAESWFVLAHFLRKSELNHLIGAMKGYIEYTENIDRRAKYLSGERFNVSKKREDYKSIIPILEFVMNFNGQISNTITDYFDSEEEYADYLNSFILFAEEKDDKKIALKNFCNLPAPGSPTGKIGIFYDEQNPILNRNVVLSKMYGIDELFIGVYRKNRIKLSDYQSYYRLSKELESVFKSGVCKSEDEVKKLKKFQHMKNRVEMTDIATFTGIVNDLYSQLISWTYLRERDFMYYLLGYYYVKLYQTESVQNDSPLRTITSSDVSKAFSIQNGAVLYQIVAMNTPGLPLIVFEKDGKPSLDTANAANGTGIKVVRFVLDYLGGEETYSDVLAFFGNYKKNNDDVVKMRNYIDHFSYFAGYERSLMDLYSDFFDRFFEYDQKLHKSVSFVFKNILLRYFVISDLNFVSVYRYSYKDKKEGTDKCCGLELKKERKGGDLSLKADNVTIKYKNQNDPQKVQVFARDDEFLSRLEGILTYKRGESR